MSSNETMLERDLGTIRRELRELTYSVNRVLHIVETFAASQRAPALVGTHPIDPHGLFAKAQAETQGRTLEESVVPPDSAR